MNDCILSRARPRRCCAILISCLVSTVGLGRGQGEAEQISYHYDDAGRLIGVNYEGGKSISYLYDAGGNILRKVVTQIVDTDDDFMDDDFERTHFTNLDRDGKADFDGDGFSDLEEFLAGTSPADNTSFLKVSDFGTEGLGFQITWKSIIGKIYRVQYTDDLGGPVWKDLAGDVIANSESSSKTDQTEDEDGKRFYRVVVL